MCSGFDFFLQPFLFRLSLQYQNGTQYGKYYLPKNSCKLDMKKRYQNNTDMSYIFLNLDNMIVIGAGKVNGNSDVYFTEKQ